MMYDTYFIATFHVLRRKIGFLPIHRRQHAQHRQHHAGMPLISNIFFCAVLHHDDDRAEERAGGDLACLRRKLADALAAGLFEKCYSEMPPAMFSSSHVAIYAYFIRCLFWQRAYGSLAVFLSILFLRFRYTHILRLPFRKESKLPQKSDAYASAFCGMIFLW